MSDYDRGKYYGKKKFQNTKDGTNHGRSFYGRRSPNNLSSTKSDKDDTNIKQPTILLKPREQTIDETTTSGAAVVTTSTTATAATVTKRIQQKEDATITITPAATATTTESQSVPTVKTMTKSVKFLDESVLICENIQEYVQENNDFLVVGIIGGPGVGKSTILNLLAHNRITDKLKNVLFRNATISKSDEYNDCIKILTDSVNDTKLTNDNYDSNNRNVEELFKIQTIDDIENNRNCTHGIDLFVTQNRTIFLDCQPIQSISILDELIQCDNKRTNLFNEFVQLENCNEIYNLQLTTFLLSVCHILIVVQDWFFDSNIIRFLHTAEMLKPTHTNPEDELLDHFPHLLLIQNKAKMDDFTPAKIQIIQQTYDLLFEKTKLQKHTILGLVSSRLMNRINEENYSGPFNIFLIPEYTPSTDHIYTGHPPFEDLIKQLRANILGCSKNALTHYPLTEKTWLAYCTKVWENVKKSSFFVEYTKLMP